MNTRYGLSIGLAVLAGLAVTGRLTPALQAQDRERMERLERLENRVNEVAERQEQMMHRIEAQMAERHEQLVRRLKDELDHRGPQPQSSPNMPMPMPPQGQSGPGPDSIRGPMPPQGQPGPMPGNVGNPMPPQKQPGAAPTRAAQEIAGILRGIVFVGFICNILLAIWIYTDIRKRGEGSGIFVAMALVAGIPAAIIYALTRIADKNASAP